MTIWERAAKIAEKVEEEYGISDGGDIALEEIHRDPSQSDEEIACKVAHLMTYQ